MGKLEGGRGDAPAMPFARICWLSTSAQYSAATTESRHASVNAPMYRRGRRLILSVSAAPVNAPNAERMLFAKL